MANAETARRALGLIDLTNLNDDCTPADIDTLCDNARTPHGNTAAVCVWPRFVAQSAKNLAGSGVKIATVVNFPSGNLSVDAVRKETLASLEDGADEIDLVIPYQAFKAGDQKAAKEMIAAIRAIIPAPARLKVILETGELADATLIRQASDMALQEGADFIKTSTGKVKENATLASAKIMLEALRDHGDRARGFKPAGGIRTVKDAGDYLALADQIMGADWVSPSTFRFGASGVLSDVLAVIEGRAASATKSAY